MLHDLADINVKLCLFQDGTRLEPQGVFQVYAEKLFWEGEQKAKENECDQPVSNWNTELLLSLKGQCPGEELALSLLYHQKVMRHPCSPKHGSAKRKYRSEEINITVMQLHRM